MKRLLTIPAKNKARTRPTINQALANQSKSRNEEEPNKMQRRAFLTSGALGAALLSSSGQVLAQAQQNNLPNDPFIILLKGLYQSVPAGRGPANNLGLTTVNLSNGSYARTQIYPVWIGIPGSQNQNRAIGTFYVDGGAGLCAYDLPGGAIAMQFTGGGFPMIIPDGAGGQFLEGTFELTILEATGLYSAFNGGHNHMVDRLHQLVAGTPLANFPSGYDEFCFCIISTYPFP